MAKGKQTGGPRLQLTLFLAGDSHNSVLALSRLRECLAKHVFEVEPELEIVDVLRSPSRALAEGVWVTPTLVRRSPKPETRLLGNLQDENQLLAVLNAMAENTEPSEGP